MTSVEFLKDYRASNNTNTVITSNNTGEIGNMEHKVETACNEKTSRQNRSDTTRETKKI